ncbi:MAG TPA: GMC family oxidoreductase [Polyangiaceae bacterium]|jgi:choline dehydrogenase-like flavoprotein|nr:GMC family oxidoreductase [Polyangiaceae bacterium]
MILRAEDYRKSATFDADVVVVGTGAGGAVVGAELAEAGRSVIFVEEGSHHETSSFGPYLTESVPRLYRDAGSTVILGNPMIPYVEGRAVGGSTVINGGMAYRTPEDVLVEWQKTTGLVELGPQALEPLFDRVEQKVRVSPQLDESVGGDSKLMVEGARKMGWRVSVNKRNQHACVGANNCGFGCPTGAKQSTLVSYMPAALAAGAHCLTEVRIDELLIENGRCVGVKGFAVDPVTRAPTHPVVVRARAVVIACGAVQTPYLLARHRVGRPSGQLGKNFLCHPNAKVLAVYPFDVEAWKGVSQYAQIREFIDEGILMAENFISPGALGAHIPFHGADAWELMSRYNQMVLSGVLVEDSTTGSVSRSRFGMPEARYDVTAQDHARFLRGVKLLAEMHFALGAERVLLPFTTFSVATSADELRAIDERRIPRSALELFTVHLMGTARMGGSRTTSVVDPSGELWDLPGCYVADASLFPTAIGVNPQITIMALATRVAWRLELARRAA